jgi:hypothetical protein
VLQKKETKALDKPEAVSHSCAAPQCCLRSVRLWLKAGVTNFAHGALCALQVKTHLRDMPILPEMVGSVVGVYNGKVYNVVEVCGVYVACLGHASIRIRF